LFLEVFGDSHRPQHGNVILNAISHTSQDLLPGVGNEEEVGTSDLNISAFALVKGRDLGALIMAMANFNVGEFHKLPKKRPPEWRPFI
jgi:hypothetical protein